MAKKVATVSGAGQFLDFMIHLASAVKRKGGDLGKYVEEAVQDGGNQEAFEKLAELIVGTKESAATILKVVVDYGKSLAEMIAAGKYDGYINSDITEKHFPIPKIPAGLPTKFELNLELVHFNRVITSNQVLDELRKQRLRPATLLELLALGATYPEKQREFPIVALGSVWRYLNGDRYVPYLWSNADGRDLRLDWFVRDWDEDYRFLAVRES